MGNCFKIRTKLSKKKKKKIARRKPTNHRPYYRQTDRQNMMSAVVSRPTVGEVMAGFLLQLPLPSEGAVPPPVYKQVDRRRLLPHLILDNPNVLLYDIDIILN